MTQVAGFSLDERRPIETDGRGNVLYEIFAQDGSRVPMRCADTPSNRMFVLWLRQTDRYSHQPNPSSERGRG